MRNSKFTLDQFALLRRGAERRRATVKTIDDALRANAAACQRLEARASRSRSKPPTPVRYTPEQRDALYEAVRCRVRDALHRAEGAHARRRAEREAVHVELEEQGLIQRTRGGVPSARQKADTLL